MKKLILSLLLFFPLNLYSGAAIDSSGESAASIAPSTFTSGAWTFGDSSTVTIRGLLIVSSGASTTNDALYVGLLNNRVGIGTSNPGAKLDVRVPSGSLDILNLISGGSEVMTVTVLGNVGIGTISPGAALDIIENNDGAALRVSTATNTTGAALTVTSENEVFIGQNVSVDTYKFNVGGPAGPSGLVRMSTSVTAGHLAFFVGSSNNVGIGTINPDATFTIDSRLAQDLLTIKDGGTEVFTILDGGNVGIGNVSPVGLFEVGVDTFVVDSDGVGIGTGDPTDVLHIVINDVNPGVPANKGLLLQNLADGGVGIEFQNTDFNTNLFQIFLDDVSGGLVIGRQSLGDYVLFETGGNVGIGTSDPLSKVHVRVTATNATDGLEIDDGTANLVFYPGTSAAAKMGSETAHDVSIITGNVARMTFQNATGEIGIGTGNPSSRFHLYGTGVTMFMAEQTSTGDAGSVYTANSLQNWAIGLDNDDGDKFKISSANVLGTNDRFVIEPAGNVGIGTNSPSSDFHVFEGTSTLGGHLVFDDTTPSVSSCGTGSPSVTGTDNAGRITMGSGGSANACTLTFGQPWTVAPACVAIPNVSEVAVSAAVTTTEVVFTFGATIATETVGYICLGF